MILWGRAGTWCWSVAPATGPCCSITETVCHRADADFPFFFPPNDTAVEKKKPHIKKPLNAFMLYMKEMRAKVVAECTLKESAAINQILGRRVSSLLRCKLEFLLLFFFFGSSFFLFSPLSLSLSISRSRCPLPVRPPKSRSPRFPGHFFLCCLDQIFILNRYLILTGTGGKLKLKSVHFGLIRRQSTAIK